MISYFKVNTSMLQNAHLNQRLKFRSPLNQMLEQCDS